MKELDQILDAWRIEPRGVLATVVQVKGSAYRRPGARMLIQPDGERIGSVSGGCLEGDLSRKAWWLTESGRPALRTYDTMSGDDAVWEFGLGCNGVIDVLLERVDTAESSEVLAFLEQTRKRRETARIATVIRGPLTGQRLLIGADSRVAGSLQSSELAYDIEPLLRNSNANQVVTVGDSEVFLEIVEPSQPLIIFGAGHDAIPLVTIAKELGWHVTVADGRPAYASVERFPTADCVTVLRHDRPLEHLAIPPEAAVVFITHNYIQDRTLLPFILARSVRYLGILGPRVRTDRLFEEVGWEPPKYLHAPVGLDIGAGSPETIAVAIVSEISAVLAGRAGGLLRDRQGPIYEHPVVKFGTNQPVCELL